MDSNFSDAGFVRNSFDSKIYDSIDSKVKNDLKNSIKINSKFVRFDSTPALEHPIDFGPLQSMIVKTPKSSS